MVLSTDVLQGNLAKIAYTLDKSYLSELSRPGKYHILPFDEYSSDATNHVSHVDNIRAVRVDRWVYNKDEKPGDCFKNVLSLFADGEHALALVVVRRPTSTETYLVVRNSGYGRNEDSRRDRALLNDAIQGNFPGTHTIPVSPKEAMKLLSFDTAEAVAVLCNTPSEYSEDYITQGLDKLLNGIIPHDEADSYAVVFLAESLAANDIRAVISGFEDMATAMHPFESHQFQVGSSRTDTQTEMSSIASSRSISESISRTHSVNVGFRVGDEKLGLSVGYGYGYGRTRATTTSETTTTGTSSSVSVGTSENTSYTYKSYMVHDLIQKTEHTIERLMHSQATGLWKFATYVFAQDLKSSKNIANFLRAVTQGKESYIEPCAIGAWRKQKGYDSHTLYNYDHLHNYVAHFVHPVFLAKDADGYPIQLTPTAYVGTDEVSHVVAFPRKSVPGLPVLECVAFGRNAVSLSLERPGRALYLGNIFHMHREERVSVDLSLDSLSAHTFITGSTGAGKTNAVRHLLDKALEQGVKFLVIEPAKGEYKDVLGGRVGVSVYGTNPALVPLLRINPFSFPTEGSRGGVHVLEHLDRLVEVFCACWPMYAAMPAVLKDAMERSYADCGWDLVTSTNPYGADLWPTLADVARNVRHILDESDYDAENKGAYKGSLLTRLNSLSNGINGLILTDDEISPGDLFDNNVIVDLSRVGSSETKALLMGMLVLKLQEWRMTMSSNVDVPLRHLTVLEEAHNLLRRTSPDQSPESGNLLGKSVEMLANAIAEMRAYGEGFVIADQAPNLLDLSVIRNTNTKLILRLPDQADRELVGRAANLNDEQIAELARLPRGVAAVYQNDWVEPVLCKVSRAEPGMPYRKEKLVEPEDTWRASDALSIAGYLIRGVRIAGNAELKDLSLAMQRLRLPATARVSICKMLENSNREPSMSTLAPIMSMLFPRVREAIVSAHVRKDDVGELFAVANEALHECVDGEASDLVMNAILQGVVIQRVHHELHQGAMLEEWIKREGVQQFV